MLSRVLAATALASALAACAQRAPQPAASAPPAAATVAPALRAVQQRLAEQDRAADARLLASVRRYASATARDVTPAGARAERLVVTVTNHAARELYAVDGRVRLFRGRDARRLGLATFHAAVDVAPGRSASVTVAIPLGTFAEGGGPLALESGRSKLVELELTGVAFERGRAAAETD